MREWLAAPTESNWSSFPKEFLRKRFMIGTYWYYLFLTPMVVSSKKVPLMEINSCRRWSWWVFQCLDSSVAYSGVPQGKVHLLRVRQGGRTSGDWRHHVSDRARSPGNSPVFATALRYGQTGSGKTFTMMGPPKRQVEIQGSVLPKETLFGMGDSMKLTLPSGKRSHNYGKSPCWRGKSTISMGYFQ